MSIEIRPNEAVPLELLLVDGDDTKYPLAHVVDENHNPIPGSPFSLSNIGLGRYVNDDFILPSTYVYRRLTATYIVYLDSGFTEEDLFYERAEDIFDMKDPYLDVPVSSRAGQNEVQVAILSIPSQDLVGIVEENDDLVGIVEEQTDDLIGIAEEEC